MATLSQATQATRTILRWIGIAFAAFLVFRIILLPGTIALYNKFFPEEPPAPTVAFDKIPRIHFSSAEKPPSFTYTIGTTTGTLPPTCVLDACQSNEDPTKPVNIPDRAQVFRTFSQIANFSSYDRAKQKVSSVGFTSDGTALSNIVYQWRHPKIEGRQITFNIITDEFSISASVPPPSSEDPSQQKLPPQREQAIQIATNFMSALSLLSADIDGSKTKTTFLRKQNGKLIKASSLSESELVQVDFYRKPLASLSIVYPNPSRSLISFLITGDQNGHLAIIDGQFSYKYIDMNNPSTYPIKTAMQAFEELKAGKAYISSFPLRSNNQTIVIEKAYLAYYEGNNAEEFIQPVFVFEGQGGFQAVVVAIIDQWLQ